MYALAALLLVAIDAIPPPRTVNGAVLGKAEDFRVVGPGRVCLDRISFTLQANETAYLAYAGIHSGEVRILGPEGSFLVREGDSWAEPKGGEFFEDRLGRTVARHRHKGRNRYLLYAETDYSGGDERPLVWVEGKALTSRNSAAILNRITVHRTPAADCKRRFFWGWNFILGSSDEE